MSAPGTERQDRRTAPHHPPDQPVELRRAGQYLNVAPALPWLADYLYTARHVAVGDERHGVRVEKLPFPLVWTQECHGRRYTQCFAGLEPLVRELLEVAGYEVVLAGKRPGELPAPQLDALRHIDSADTPVLDLVRGHDRGLIRYAPACVEPARLISQIGLGWPNEKILVVATRVDEAVDLRRRLQESLGRVALFTGNHHPARGARVVVATPNRLGDGAIGSERRGVALLLNPDHVITSPNLGLNQAYPDGLKCLWRARLYGLLADDASVAPWTRSWMTAVFGIEQVHVPRHGHHDLPVDAIFSRLYGGERPPTNKDDLLLKRRGLWHHHLRNRRVAALFRALAGKKTKALAGKFPGVAGHLGGRSVGRVGLLVEGVEHGLALARLLPGVPLGTGPEVWTEGLSAEDVTVLKQGTKGTKKHRAIVTAEGLARMPRFDVLIRADGGNGLPPFPEHHLAVANDEAARLLLIDFTDEHHPALAKWCRQRRNAYAAAGWGVAGRAAPRPMDLFVARRPEAR